MEYLIIKEITNIKIQTKHETINIDAYKIEIW